MIYFFSATIEFRKKRIIVRLSSRRYIEIRHLIQSSRRFCRLPSLFSFRTFGELTKANRAEIKNYVRTFMRLLIAHTPVPSYLSCVLMAIRSSKSKSTDIFPIFRESYLMCGVRKRLKSSNRFRRQSMPAVTSLDSKGFSSYRKTFRTTLRRGLRVLCLNTT